MSKAKVLDKMPSDAQLECMRQDDTGYKLASTDLVAYLDCRKQAIYNISRGFRLDPDELYQEGYEVLLTCLRDYTPVYERGDKFVRVQFTTFFGNRLEGRAMEMRNRDPEYQARQAFTDKMGDEEKRRFREDPPLLVQHLDHESPMQEMLRGEASEAREEDGMSVELKVMRDSFFERKLDELIAAEQDDKRRAVLMHVKVGGVYNFQEIAYHFGVTDSRASQIMNELMDAFYVQRLIQGNVKSVAYDFVRLKFNEKRKYRLLGEALQNSETGRQQEILEMFKGECPDLKIPQQQAAPALAQQPKTTQQEAVTMVNPINYDDVFDAKVNKDFPPVALEIKKLTELQPLDIEFRQPHAQVNDQVYAQMAKNPADYPLIINEQGQVIDGVRRIQVAASQGVADWPCMVHHTKDEKAAKQLRVLVDVRLNSPDKVDLYYAIAALEELGLSQQKVADIVKISRTNVIVYSKLRNRGSAKLQQLFADGLIQITNASSCTDLSHDLQDQVADFIRAAGVQWSKGSQFTALYEAAAENRLAAFSEKHLPQGKALAAEAAVAAAEVPGQKLDNVSAAQKRRLEAYEQALRDSEVWAAQRESVINRQTDDLVQAFNEIERLKKELQAAELSRFGSPEALDVLMKEMRAYYAVSERVSGAVHGLEIAAKDLAKLELRRQQHIEVAELIDTLDQHVNALRVALVNKGPVPVKVKSPSTKATGSAKKSSN